MPHINTCNMHPSEDDVIRVGFETFIAVPGIVHDKNEPVLVDGRVKIIPEVKEAIHHFAEEGFFAGHQSEDLGGIQLRWVVSQACFSIFKAENIAIGAYPFLTFAAANVVEAFHSGELKARFLPQMLVSMA